MFGARRKIQSSVQTERPASRRCLRSRSGRGRGTVRKDLAPVRCGMHNAFQWLGSLVSAVPADSCACVLLAGSSSRGARVRSLASLVSCICAWQRPAEAEPRLGLLSQVCGPAPAEPLVIASDPSSSAIGPGASPANALHASSAVHVGLPAPVLMAKSWHRLLLQQRKQIHANNLRL